MTVMDCVVAPVDQRYESAVEAVRTTSSPAQKVVGPSGVMLATGAGVTLTFVAAEESLQPLVVTVTLKEPLVVTVIDCVVSPVDQRYESAAEAVRMTSSPAQNDVGPSAVIVATGFGVTETFVAGDVSLQPFVVTVTL